MYLKINKNNERFMNTRRYMPHNEHGRMCVPLNDLAQED